MKRGEEMNLGLIQAIGGNVQQQVTGNPLNNQKSGFGSIFSSMTSHRSLGGNGRNGDEVASLSDETLLALFEADSIDDLETVFETLASQFPTVSLFDEGGWKDLEQIDLSEILEKMQLLLEQAGLSESERIAALEAQNIWEWLTTLEPYLPQLFVDIQHAFENKGEMTKDQAVELLAFFKMIGIQAPKMDLTMKEEQQLFSLQSYLQETGGRVESGLQAQPNRTHSFHLIESHHPIRLEVQSESSGSNLKDESKESMQSTVVNSLVATRSESTLVELENKQNARNEALMREMQNIFKRSSFGQAGGTNRLLMKLYPEHLGQVRIELLQVNGVMTARILASTALGKEMLDSQLAQLRTAFAQQNLQVDRIDISQSLQDTPRQERDHAFNQHFRQPQEEFEEQEEKSQEEEMTFEEYMIELEV